MNLINNSTDAVKKNADRWVRINFSTTKDLVEIKVEDSGLGINPELQSKIFNPFFTTKPPGEGTGMGLGVCVKIVEQHGGSFRLDTEAKNTCFVVSLPLNT